MFLRKIVLMLVFILPLTTYAETLQPPSLTETMQFNEQVFKNTTRLNLREKIALRRQARQQSPTLLTYSTIKQGDAVTLYKYDTMEMWVQEVDLSKWAHLDSVLNLAGYDADTGEPLFMRKNFVLQVQSAMGTPFSAINGQFFNMKMADTQLSFGVKQGDTVRTAGADNGTIAKNIFSIVGNTAKILPYTWEHLNDANSNFAIGNLTVTTSHYADSTIGRTYICIPNPDTNISNSKFLIWTALASTEATIEGEMYRWGCKPNSVAKLDSSGSTRLYADGKYYYGNAHKWVPDYRSIPHTIVIYDR